MKIGYCEKVHGGKVCKLCNATVKSKSIIEMTDVGGPSRYHITVSICSDCFDKFFAMIDAVKEQVLVRKLSGLL